MATITVDLTRGKKIFENIEEYPLPKKPGIKDYIFYFVSKSKGYGLGASTFFNKYYGDHIEKNAKSLEEIIEILHSEIKSKTIDQIREIVIVCHANMRELLFPVTKHAFDNDQNKAKYQIVRPGTLVNLQEAFKADDLDLKDFKKNRKEVIKKLFNTSRITIRACNFGASRDGLFALYSFFGGRANVYAPHEYQFFLDRLGIGVESRLKTDLDFYQHLVKQGYISRKTKHSESRKVKIIKKLIEPGRGRHRFELSSYRIQNNRVVNGDKDEHDSFVSSLNQKTVSDAVREKFVQEDLSLSGDERIQIRQKDEKWILFDDRLRISGHTYKIEYTIQEEFEQFTDDENHQASLYVYPILNHRKSLPSIPLQLFFSEDQNDDYKCQILELAAFPTVPDHGITDTKAKEDYDAYEKILDEGKFQDNNGHNILAAFEEEAFPLTDPKIVQLPPHRNKKQWEIQDEINFKVKETFQYLYPVGFKTALEVFEPVTREKRLDFFEFQGSDPDTPGTELMAYLDNRSLEELYDFIHFLREPYKEEHAFYIYMAQEAMKRKAEFNTWPVKVEEDERRKSDPIYIYPSWAMLNDVERDDKEKYAYLFSNVWMEAKASTSRNKDFNDDLFEERKLPFPAETIGKVVEPDTPENEEEIMEQDPNNPQSVPDPPQEYFDKEMVFEEIRHEDLNCKKFKEALEIIKQNQGKSWEEIERIFKETRVSETSDTLYNYLTSNYAYSSFEIANEVLQMFSPYASGTGIVGRLGMLANSRFVFAGSVFFAIAGPALMLKSILDEVSKGKENYKRAGVITGFKEGKEKIGEIIYKYNAHRIPIADNYDLLSDARDHKVAYIDFTGERRIPFPMAEFIEPHREGYEIGLKEVENALNEDLRKHMSIFKEFVLNKGLKECHFKELLNSGLIDDNMVKRAILQGLFNQISTKARYDLVNAE